MLASYWSIARRLLGPHRLLRAMNLYPPFLGAGIRVTRVSKDLRRFDVELPLTRLNRNYVGTHFGGSLFAMCDPFFMLILIEALGAEYVVWDKAASIRFVRPGRGTVRATFSIPQERVEEIREKAKAGKVDETFAVEVVGEGGEVVARVEKVVQIRLKAARPADAAASARLPG